MGFKQRRWFLLWAVALALSLAACGTSPTPAADQITTIPPTEEVKPTASAPPTATPTQAAIPTEEPPPSPTATYTPPPAAAISPTPPPPSSRCEGLAGDIEIQVLVGPAEAVGMEPEAVGDAPFSVVSSEPPYLVQGGSSIAYEGVQTHEWGTYSVSLDMEITLSGECTGTGGEEALYLILEATGEQMVVVEATGFQGEYPWSGSHTFDLTFPLVEGATVQGEGYTFVLHLPDQG
jgi:hypothetical protein